MTEVRALPRMVDQAARALARGLFDRGAGVPEERLTWLMADVADFLAAAGPRTRTFFMLTVLAIELGAPLAIGRLARLSRLSPKTRDEALLALDRSRRAILLALPKAILSLAYYEHPDARRETGYDGACLLGELPAGVGLVQLPRGGG